MHMTFENSNFERAILGLPSQSAHPPSLNTGAPGWLADNILRINDAEYGVISY